MSERLLNNRVFKTKLVFIQVIVGLFLIYSCEKKQIEFVKYENTSKDILSGDTAIFVGTWNWIYSDHEYGWCDNQNYYEYLNPSAESTSFNIRFYEQGFLNYFKNDTLINHFRISFQYFDFINQSNCNHFAIDMDGFDDLSFSGCIESDTLKCYAPGFLFFEEAGCEQYINYFVKE